MADDWYRLIKQAYDAADRVQQPAVRPNRTLLAFTNAEEAVALQESLTTQATANPWPAKWGATTQGPGGGSWRWGAAGKWR